MKTDFLDTQMKQENKMLTWPEFISKSPLIAAVLVKNNESTVYDCLKSVHNLFDAIIVIIDGSIDNSLLEIDRFIRREHSRNVHVFDLTSQDPWPQINDANHEIDYAKSKSKCLSLAKSLAHGSLLLDIDADFVIDEDSRFKIVRTIEKWDRPDINFSSFRITNPTKDVTVDSPTRNATVTWLGGNLIVGPDSFGEKCSFYFKEGENLMQVSSREDDKTCIGRFNLK